MADIERVLISPEDLERRLDELAWEITDDYCNKNLVLVGVLKGCVPFLSDLTRRLLFKHAYDLVGAASYGASTQSSGQVRITKDLDVDIEGRHVLITEDILDTGLTLRAVIELLQVHKPAGIEICALLRKQTSRRVENIPLRYVGFEIPDEFVVGYGLDYNDTYRNLPCIGVLRQEIYARR